MCLTTCCKRQKWLCKITVFFSYLITDKKKKQLSSLRRCIQQPLRIFPLESYFEWTGANIIRYIACWTGERTDRVRQFERKLKATVVKEPASLAL